jgi:hypothetical protein
MPTSVRYSFKQRFSVSAQDAFDWCIAFDAGDHALMGDTDAKRQITRIADGSMLLTDSFQTSMGKVEKQKLVQLYPDKLQWTSTHLSGPNKHSQFLYAITSKGKDVSVLEFTALHIEYDEKTDAKTLGERLCREDADAWKLLAQAMKKEIG